MNACNWVDAQSTCSKVCQFLFLHIVHIKHEGTRIQILASLLCHPHNKSRTFPANTHLIPNILNIKLHNSSYTTMYQKLVHGLPTTTAHTIPTHHWIKPLFIRFSQVRTFLQAAVHTKKETLQVANPNVKKIVLKSNIAHSIPSSI